MKERINNRLLAIRRPGTENVIGSDPRVKRVPEGGLPARLLYGCPNTTEIYNIRKIRIVAEPNSNYRGNTHYMKHFLKPHTASVEKPTDSLDQTG